MQAGAGCPHRDTANFVYKFVALVLMLHNKVLRLCSGMYTLLLKVNADQVATIMKAVRVF